MTQIAEEISKDKDGGAIGIVGFSQGAGMASVIAALGLFITLGQRLIFFFGAV